MIFFFRYFALFLWVLSPVRTNIELVTIVE